MYILVRIPRSDYDLLKSLQDQVKLLKKYYVEAFQKDDLVYLGEIAGKLRVLIHEKGSNTPLLLSLMDKFQIEIPITLDGPPIEPLRVNQVQEIKFHCEDIWT